MTGCIECSKIFPTEKFESFPGNPLSPWSVLFEWVCNSSPFPFVQNSKKCGANYVYMEINCIFGGMLLFAHSCWLVRNSEGWLVWHFKIDDK